MTAGMDITHYPSLDDARLAQQAHTDAEAFAELYRRHLTSVYRCHRAQWEYARHRSLP